MGPVMSDASGVPATAASDAIGGSRRVPYAFLAITALITLAADLGTKLWAERRLGTDSGLLHPVELIEGHLDFVLAKNPAGAWSLLQDVPDGIRRPLFMILSVVAIVFIVSVYRRLVPEQWALRWGLPLVLGGALGNLVDRIRYSYVIDFIHMHATWGGRDHHWPTYNVADIAICIGVGLMALDMLTGAKGRGPEQSKPDAS
jgi:lipoprotein signal peptidase